MVLFTRLCRFVDWDLSRTGGVKAGAYSLLLALLPFLLLVGFAGLLDVRPNLVACSVAIVVSVAWTALVAWRGWRLLKVYATKGDRRYDRRGKLNLPPEYRGSKSVTKARGKRTRS